MQSDPKNNKVTKARTLNFNSEVPLKDHLSQLSLSSLLTISLSHLSHLKEYYKGTSPTFCREIKRLSSMHAVNVELYRGAMEKVSCCCYNYRKSSYLCSHILAGFHILNVLNIIIPPFVVINF